MKRILIVEDETSIREMLALNLSVTGYEVVEAVSAEQALEHIDEAKQPFDVAILDVMLPKMNGFSLCEIIRKDNSKIGIIILSAKAQEADKIGGLSIGADDYITKPFSVALLLARVEALCRRISQPSETSEQEGGRLVAGCFELCPTSHLLYKNSVPIDLTQVEYGIMMLFFKNPNVAMVREQILKGVWGDNYYGDVKIVDVNIRRLRMKIEEDPSSPKHILTVWGYGYRWNSD